MDVESMKLLAAALCMGIGTIAPAIGEGFVGGKAMEAMGRNPSIANKIFVNMIVCNAIIESIAIYALVVSLIILFVF